MITIRRAGADDAQKIGAVFDAAVRDGWKYLGELVSRPMFPPEEWDKLVTEHAPPNALLVAVNETDQVVGYTAVHPQEGEMHLLLVHPEHAGRGVGRALLAAAHEALRRPALLTSSPTTKTLRLKPKWVLLFSCAFRGSCGAMGFTLTPQKSYMLLNEDLRTLQMHSINIKAGGGSAKRDFSAGEYGGEHQVIPQNFAIIGMRLSN